MDALVISDGKNNAKTSLRVSLELSIKHMNKTNPDALKLFGFIGLLPGGVSEAELTRMWGSKEWIPLKDALIRASLLVYKTDAAGNFTFNMLPFMNIRACEYLEQTEELHNNYHMKCCKLFKEYNFNFYESQQLTENIEVLVEMESNIWACIYRSCNRKRDIQYLEASDDDEPDQDKDNIDAINAEEFKDPGLGDLGDLKEPVINRGVSTDCKQATPDQLKTEKEFAKKSNAIKSKPKHTPKSECNDEEMLVLYYASNLIMLNKNSDAQKALTEYMHKDGISELCQANLYKALAVLASQSKKPNDVQEAITYFKKAAKLFTKLNIKKGIGICKYGIAKVFRYQWDLLVKSDGEKSESELVEKALNLCQGALKLFKQINWPRGEFLASKFEEVLLKQNNKKFVPKPAKYYMQLCKLANMEKDSTSATSWINAEQLCIIEVITQDDSIVHVDRESLNKSMKSLNNKERIAMEKARIKDSIDKVYKNPTKANNLYNNSMSSQKPSKKSKNTAYYTPSNAKSKMTPIISPGTANEKLGIMGYNDEIAVQKALLEQFSHNKSSTKEAQKTKK